MTETIRYSLIGTEDIHFGIGSFETILADGRTVLLRDVDLGAILSDRTLSSRFGSDAMLPVTAKGSTTGRSLEDRFAEFTNVLDFGAVADGTTNINDAVLLAMAAGHTRLYIPANTRWVPSTDTIPSGLDITGENWNSCTIESSIPFGPFAVDLQCGNNTILRNVRLRHRFGYHDVPPADSDKYVPLRFYMNTSGATRPITAWPNEFFLVDTSGSDQGSEDRPGASINTYGMGDALFLQTLGAGPALRMWHRGSSIGAVLERRVSQIGFQIITADPAAIGAADLSIATTHKTFGEMLNLFHSTTTYNGDALLMNLGFNGGFGGRFVRLMKNGVVMLDIDNNANLKMTGGGQVQLENSRSLIGVKSAGGTKVLAGIDANDNIAMEFERQTSIGNNGAASPLTANPLGYIKLNIVGYATVLIPFYNP